MEEREAKGKKKRETERTFVLVVLHEPRKVQNPFEIRADDAVFRLGGLHPERGGERVTFFNTCGKIEGRGGKRRRNGEREGGEGRRKARRTGGR